VLAGALLLVLVDGSAGISTVGSHLALAGPDDRDAAAPSVPPSGESADGVSGSTASTEAVPAPTRVPPPVPVDVPAVLGQVQQAAAPTGGVVEVVVVDGASRTLLASPGAQRQLFTASLIKLLVVAELLEQQASGVPLAPDDTALMERAATASDDAAMSVLWVRHDGPALVTAAAARLDLTATAPPARVGQWGEALMSATDVATFLSRVGTVYGSAVAGTLTGWLQRTAPRAADGFDQRFGLLAPGAGVLGPVAAKQGWMCCVGGRRILHSAGVLADGRVVVLLGDFPAAASWSAARTALEAAAGAVVRGTAAPASGS